MRPLPKWMGYLGTLAVVAPTVYTAWQAGGWQAAILALLTVLGGGATLFSHSATGTGGTPPNP